MASDKPSLNPFISLSTLSLIIASLLLVIKFTIIRSYHSTDFEVHRNWMSITYHLPIDQWYRTNLSQWTLDYPPYFAYFEWILSQLAALFDHSIITLQTNVYFSANTLLFQRITVIICDMVYLIACFCIAKNYINQTQIKGKGFQNRLKMGLFSCFICNPALIMLDNIHFQYNNLLYGLFLFSINEIVKGNILQGALIFSILLNFKHIYLYYAPAFIGFYLCSYLLPVNRRFVVRFFLLGFMLLSVFFTSFGPFICQDFSLLQQILSRLFPFKRGLTHANWAPNFWVIYNLADFLLAKLMAIVAMDCTKFPGSSLKNCPPPPPEYTRGLVQEYSHSVLPNINPTITLALILVFLTPCAWIFMKKFSNKLDQFLIALTLSAYSFFLFGWHVHEKAILMIFFPMGLLAIKDLRFIESFSLLCISSTFAQFPLFFTPLENVLKLAFAIAYFSLCLLIANKTWGVHPAELVQSKIGQILIKIMFIAELYAIVGHRMFFPNKQLEFLPIIVTSFASSLALFYSYLRFIMTLFGEKFWIGISKNLLIRKEKRILHSEYDHFSGASNVHHFAGIDLSSSVDHPELAVISLTVLAYPSMEIVYCADEFMLLANGLCGVPPYIPEYLAIREAEPLKRAISRHIQKCPKIDILFVDSNGKWHSRGCGLASHVGYDHGLVTIGIAKKFNGFPLYAHGIYGKEELKRIEMFIEKQCKEAADEAILFEFTSKAMQKKDLPRLAIIRPKSSKAPFFISPGFGIDFETAANFAFACVGKNATTLNPVRMNDLRSRKMIKNWFEC